MGRGGIPPPGKALTQPQPLWAFFSVLSPRQTEDFTWLRNTGLNACFYLPHPFTAQFQIVEGWCAPRLYTPWQPAWHTQRAASVLSAGGFFWLCRARAKQPQQHNNPSSALPAAAPSTRALPAVILVPPLSHTATSGITAPWRRGKTSGAAQRRGEQGPRLVGGSRIPTRG
jgi:hypothetical protein